MTTRLVMLGALLIPALAAAQPASNDPYAPAPTQAAPEAPPPAPVTTEAPAVIVNPPPPAPAPTTVIIPPEPEYRVVRDPYNASVFASGALVFAASYGASVITAAATDDERNDRLYVPVVGPWLALNERGDCDILESRCDNETTAKVLLIADGVFQAAGVVGMIHGVLRPSSHRVYATSAKLDTKTRVRPTMVRGSASAGPGITVLGRF